MKIKIVPLSHVTEWTELSRSTIYRRISKGIFPKPVPISKGIVPQNVRVGKQKIFWVEEEVTEWIHKKWENERLIKLKKVMAMTGLSSSVIYKKIKKGIFPRPSKPPVKNGKSLGWVDEEIYQWIRERINRIDELCYQKSINQRTGNEEISQIR